MAFSCLADVDPKEIAAAGHAELDALEVEEVWDRAGPFYRHGYVYPGEATYQMMEEVLSPFFFELEKYQQLGMNAQANKVCTGAGDLTDVRARPLLHAPYWLVHWTSIDTALSNTPLTGSA